MVDYTPSTASIIYGDTSRLPRSARRDIRDLFRKVRDWRGQNSSGKNSYKKVARSLGFDTEKSLNSLARKRLDLFKHYHSTELDYRVAIEVETSTIENGYNDLLKIMQLLKADEVDYGLVIFIQNNRSTRPKLKATQLESNLVNGLGKVLEDFRGKLFIYHHDPENLL